MMIYLDDERPTPEGWVRTYTVRQTIDVLLNPNIPKITHLSLDNDLGEGQPEGFKVLDWLEQQVYNDPTFPVPVIMVHSANPVRRAHMLRTLRSISDLSSPDSRRI
jgi:hypothetical protein